MNKDLMHQYIKEIWSRYTNSRRSLLVLNSFRAHYTQPVIDGYEKANSRSVIISGGCTNNIQTLNVSINRSCKDSLRRSWVGYMESLVNAGVAKIPRPSSSWS